MIRVAVVLLLAAGFATSAIVDSSNKSQLLKNTQWDDDDSMTLVSTTTTSEPSSSLGDVTTTPSSFFEDHIAEEQQRPRFISLIPAGTHDVNARSKSDQEGQDQVTYRIHPKLVTTTMVNNESIEQEDSSTPGSATQSSSTSEEEEGSHDDDDSESSEQVTTEVSRIKHIQLGKIPLTYEIIPLLPPREEKLQLLGREDTKPIGFFPPEEMMTARAKPLRREHEEQQTEAGPSTEEEDTTEIITGKPVADLKELPPVPLTYMIPPNQDEEINYWNQYPLPTTTNNNMGNLDLPQTTTINPLLERINNFLSKARRHSLEMESTTGHDSESTTFTTTGAEEDVKNVEKVETVTSVEKRKDEESTERERDTQQHANTLLPEINISDTPEDSNGNLNPSSPVPIPEEPQEEIIPTRGPTILYPRPNVPETQDFSPESEPLFPYNIPSSSPLPPQNAISMHPSSTDQYFSDYSNINYNAPQQQPLNPYYYTNSNPASILRRRMMISSLLGTKPEVSTTTTLPPSPPIYISPDSYWPQKYFNRDGIEIGNSNNGYNKNVFAPMDYNTNNKYNSYNPFMSSPSSGRYNHDYNYYLQPQQQSTAYAFPPTSTSIPIGVALNSILSSTSEEPSYSASYSNADRNDYSSFGNPYYSRGRNNYYSYPSTTQAPSPYVINYRPSVPYRRSIPITSSDLVNELMMYAPLYPYEQYRRFQEQQSGYY